MSFYTYKLDLSNIEKSSENNIFTELSTNINYEDICKGRKGTNLVNKKEDVFSLVRTTTVYKKPSFVFLPIHKQIIDEIKNVINVENNKKLKFDGDYNFNNALIEIYDDNYKKMKFHSDLDLDLKQDSYICIFSCYKNPLFSHKRIFSYKKKGSNDVKEIPMKHGSIIIFSVKDNEDYLHKITLMNSTNKYTKNFDENRWLGITFRFSKTFVDFINKEDIVIKNYVCNKRLNYTEIFTRASEKEKEQFYKLKKNQNNKNNFTYPNITYRISPGDLLYPVKINNKNNYFNN